MSSSATQERGSARQDGPPDRAAAGLLAGARVPRLLVAGLGLGIWAAYVFTCAPGLAWYDAGELTAAAHALGIAHPTGFPLWLLLAKAGALLPVGNIALRVTLLGAGCLTLTALVAGWLAARLITVLAPSAARRGPALAFAVAALALASSSAAWRHATAAEVYGLHGLLLALLLAGLYRLLERPTPRGAAGLALLAGLGLGNHGELRLLLVAGLAPLALIGLWRRLPARTLLWALLAGLLGLSVHLALPLRAAADPAQLWDDVSSWPVLLRHLRAARIFAAFGDQMGLVSGPRAADHLMLLFRRLAADAGFVPFFSAAGGLALLLGRCWLERRAAAGPGEQSPASMSWRSPSRLLLLALFGCLTIDLLYTLLVNPMGIAAAQVLLTSVLTLAVLAGIGAAALFICPLDRRAAAERGTTAVPIAARSLESSRALLVPGLAALALAGVGLAELRDKAHARLVAPAAMTADALATPAPHALLLVSSDSLAAGLTYATVVEAARPDLRWAVRQHLWNEIGRRRVASLLPEGQPPSPTALVQAQLGQRQVRWELGGDDEERPWLDRLVPGVPTWRIAATPTDPPRPPVDLQALQRKLASWAEDLQTIADGGRQAFVLLLVTAGRYEAAAGRWDQARQAFLAALDLDPASPAVLVDLGAVASHQDRLVEAVRWTELALERQQANPVAQLNLGRYLLALRDRTGAERAFRTALQLTPRSSAALSGLAAAVANQGRLGEAETLLEQALAADPDNEEARLNLARVRELLQAQGR